MISFPLSIPGMVWEYVGTPPGLNISEARGPGVSTSRGNGSLGQAQFGEASREAEELLAQAEKTWGVENVAGEWLLVGEVPWSGRGWSWV